MLEKTKYPALLKVCEVAEILRVNEQDVYRMFKSEGLPYTKLSPRRTRVWRDELFDWLESKQACS